MLRTAPLLVVLGLLALGAVGCGDDGAPINLPDAQQVDAMPDAPLPVCNAPNKMCGTQCISVANDELNCGDCGVVCNGGETCRGSCTCPGAFVPTTITPSMFDMFQGSGGAHLAIAPTFDANGIHPVLFAYTDKTPIGEDIDLSTIPLGDLPSVIAGYNVDLASQDFDAAYVATAGTLHLTAACGTNVRGTLTDVTFSGVTGGFDDPEIDPDGCSFTLKTVTFNVGSTACPAP